MAQYMTEALQHIKTASGDGLTNDVRQRKIDINEQMVIIMGALCKLFVGDLVRGGKFRDVSTVNLIFMICSTRCRMCMCS